MRRTGWFVAVLYCATTGTLAQAQQSSAKPPSLADLDTEVVAVLSQVVGASPAIGELWPGFWAPPEFIVHRSRHVAVLYSQSGPHAGFINVTPDARYIMLSPHSYVMLGTRPRRQARLERGEPFVPYALDLEVQLESSGDVLSQIDRLVHESFHHWQVNEFVDRPGCIPQWYPRSMAFPPEFRAAVQRELAILQRAVRASSESEMRDASADYLLARKQRVSAADSLVFHIEQWQERIEGTGRYIGNAAHQLVETGTLESMPQILASGLDRQNARAGDPKVTAAGEQAARAYSTGAAITFLNSRLGESDWQSAVQQGRPLDVVLAEAVGIREYLSWVGSRPDAAEYCNDRFSRRAHIRRS